ncbi:MAG TPA: hypothetical protein VK638_06355 [Edaphobacter sp.]|nr:hypothetical protein [Edaphobacter sp.]
MAAAPVPDPNQQPQPGAAPQGAPPDPSQGGGGMPSQAPAPPELMFLAKVQQALTQFAQQYPAASSGLSKAAQGLNEAMSAITVAQPQQQAPQMSPPY